MPARPISPREIADLPLHLRQFIAFLLDRAADEMRNNSCSDLPVAQVEQAGINLSPEEVRLFQVQENMGDEDDEEEDDEDDEEEERDPRYLSDIIAMRQAARLLRGEVQPPVK